MSESVTARSANSWIDERYNMVEFQEEMKYGRSSGIALGGVDFVKFAESFSTLR